VCGEKTASQDLERFGTAEFTHTHRVTGGHASWIFHFKVRTSHRRREGCISRPLSIRSTPYFVCPTFLSKIALTLLNLVKSQFLNYPTASSLVFLFRICVL
jgi:hypothetical protein